MSLAHRKDTRWQCFTCSDGERAVRAMQTPCEEEILNGPPCRHCSQSIHPPIHPFSHQFVSLSGLQQHSLCTPIPFFILLPALSEPQGSSQTLASNLLSASSTSSMTEFSSPDVHHSASSLSFLVRPRQPKWKDGLVYVSTSFLSGDWPIGESIRTYRAPMLALF